MGLFSIHTLTHTHFTASNKKGLLIKIPHFNPLIFQFVIFEKKEGIKINLKSRSEREKPETENNRTISDPQNNDNAEEEEVRVKKTINAFP